MTGSLYTSCVVYPPLRVPEHHLTVAQDYDCFYAAVFEAENPALKSLPLAVQQKQIIVTCNYVARARGLHKLQLITDARKACPEVVIVLGEDLTRFRNASKANYKFLESFTWNKRVERLGFDEVFMDVTDIVDYNEALLNPNSLEDSFFQLARDDPTIGFSFNGAKVSGPCYPETPITSPRFSPCGTALACSDRLHRRLVLGSHLAQHIRHRLEEDQGYTSTVGISTSKLLSKLVGNVHKPKAQTTLVPPYEDAIHTTKYAHSTETGYSHNDEGSHCPSQISNVTTFLDAHDIGKIPGIGFKMARAIRDHVLICPSTSDKASISGDARERITVHDVRVFPGMGPDLLEKILGGPGTERGIGLRTWGLINGIDDSEVKEARRVPATISIEDSYRRLDTLPQIQKEMIMLTTSLLKRMHMDLLEGDDDAVGSEGAGIPQKWAARPKTIRLTTRPRPPPNADGLRTRTFARISRSAPLPNFVFNLTLHPSTLVEKLVADILLPMFRRLHPEKGGWNLSLMNIGVTNMAETASDSGYGGGRDIGKMFKRQESVLSEWKVEDRDTPPDLRVTDQEERDVTHAVGGQEHGHLAKPSAGDEAITCHDTGSEDMMAFTQTTDEVNAGLWDDEDDGEDGGERCTVCGASLPAFAMFAHERFHSLEDE